MLMIHSDTTISRIAIKTPNASASTLLKFLRLVVMWRKKTR